MGKNSYTAFYVFLFAIVMVTLIGGCTTGTRTEKTGGTSREVAALVNGARIYFNDVNEEHWSLTPQQRLDVTKADALSFLIEREVLYQEAVNQGLKVTEEEVSREYEYSMIANNLTEAELKSQLAARNSSVERLMLVLKKQLLINKLLDKKVPRQFVIKHDEAEAFYNSSNFAARGIAFEQVEKSIIDILTVQRQQAARGKYIAMLKGRADVVIVAVPS